INDLKVFGGGGARFPPVFRHKKLTAARGTMIWFSGFWGASSAHVARRGRVIAWPPERRIFGVRRRQTNAATVRPSTGPRGLTGGRALYRTAPAYAVMTHSPRRGGRVAEGGGLLNRYRALKPYRGFESHPLRQLFPGARPGSLCNARGARAG